MNLAEEKICWQRMSGTIAPRGGFRHLLPYFLITYARFHINANRSNYIASKWRLQYFGDWIDGVHRFCKTQIRRGNLKA